MLHAPPSTSGRSSSGTCAKIQVFSLGSLVQAPARGSAGTSKPAPGPSRQGRSRGSSTPLAMRSPAALSASVSRQILPPNSPAKYRACQSRHPERRHSPAAAALVSSRICCVAVFSSGSILSFHKDHLYSSEDQRHLQTLPRGEQHRIAWVPALCVYACMCEHTCI